MYIYLSIYLYIQGEGHDVSEEEHSGDEEEKLEKVKEANRKEKIIFIDRPFH